MSKVRIGQGKVFMLHFRIGGLVFIMFLIAVAFQYLPELPAIILAIVLSMGVPFFWSSVDILEIDTNRKIVSEHVLILGKRFQEKISHYDQIEKIFINKVRMAQNIHARSGRVNTVKFIEYHAFAKMNNDTKYFLVGGKNPETLKNRLSPIAQKLGVSITEN